jgi:hypothetical protein
VVFSYWILELFQQCGIFLLDFGTVPTVWYFPIGLYHTVGTVPKSNRKIVETETKLMFLAHVYMTPNTCIHDQSLSWLGKDTLINKMWHA